MRRTAATWLLLAAGALPACATSHTAVVAGKTVPRPSFGYTDHRYYALNHSDAYPTTDLPADRFHVDDGRISGRVCGVDVEMRSEIWWYGRIAGVTGFATSVFADRRTPPKSVQLYVQDHGAAGRTITGTHGTIDPLEIQIRPDRLTGVIHEEHYQLTDYYPEDDELRGTARMPTWLGERTYPFAVRGIRELWAMPAADQAVLVPMMFTCMERASNSRKEPILAVDFSGRDDAEAPPPVLSAPPDLAPDELRPSTPPQPASTIAVPDANPGAFPPSRPLLQE